MMNAYEKAKQLTAKWEQNAQAQQATGNHEGSGKTHSGKGVRQHALSFTGRSSGAPDERVQQADACGRTSDIL